MCIAINAHLSVFAGHLVTVVHTLAVGFGNGTQFRTTQELRSKSIVNFKSVYINRNYVFFL